MKYFLVYIHFEVVCAERRFEMNDMTIIPVLGIHPVTVVAIVVLVLLIAALVALSIYGRKLQKRQEETQKEMQAASQSISMLVIDKKRMKLKESGLPQLVIDQTPKYLRGQKVPIVKAKVGPKIMSMICDEKVFDLVPVKKEIRAIVSGIYIMEVKGLRSNLEVKPKKVKFSQKVKAKFSKADK